MFKKIFVILLFSVLPLMAQSWSYYGTGGYSSGWGIAIVKDTIRLPMTGTISNQYRIYSMSGTSFVYSSGAVGTWGGYWEVWNYKGTTYYGVSNGFLHIDTLSYSTDTPVEIATRTSSINDARCINDTLYYLNDQVLIRSLDGGKTIHDTMFTAPGNEYLSEMDIQGDSIFVLTNKAYSYGQNLPSGLDSGCVYKITKSGSSTAYGSLLSVGGITYSKGIQKLGNRLFAFVDATDSTYRGLYEYNYNLTWHKITIDTAYKHSNVINMASDGASKLWLSFGTASSDSNLNRIYEFRTIPNDSISILPRCEPTPGGLYVGAKIYFSSIDSRLYGMLTFAYTKDMISNGVSFYEGTSPPTAVAVFSVKSLILTLPTAGTYYQNDSLEVAWNISPDRAADTIDVYISYNNGVTYNLRKSIVGSSCYITLDSTSSSAIVKVVDRVNSESALSNAFLIYPPKLLDLTNVYFTSPSQTAMVNAVVLIKDIPSIRFYYSLDSLTWTYVATWSGISLAVHTDTLSVQIPFLMQDSAYYKVIENIDTVVYTVPLPPIISNVTPVQYPDQVCYSWGSYGGGLNINWVKDQGCGWVSTITKTYGIGSVSVNTNTGEITVGYAVTSYPWPYTGMPGTSGLGYTAQGTLIGTGYTYNGRRYYIQLDNNGFTNVHALYEQDIVNLSVPAKRLFFLDQGWGMGPVYDQTNTNVYLSGNFMLLLTRNGYPNIISFRPMSYPPTLSYTPLSDVYHAHSKTPGIPTVYSVYRGYFRGIDPKIHKGR